MLNTLLLLASIILPPQGISAELKTQTIDQLEASMKERYVLPDVADKAVKAVRAKQKAGAYDKVTSGAEFAQLLSEHLNAECKDAHLRMRYSATPLPARQNRNEASAEEIARARKDMNIGNSNWEKVERLPGNIGYFKFNGFEDGADLSRPCQAAFDFLAETDALIIDIRSNGGGSPDGVRMVCSYLFGPEPVHLNDLKFRDGDKTRIEEFWTLKELPGKRYLDKDVYVLVSKRTGSGAEEFAYNLKNLKRATILGENSWGGANPGGTVRLNDHFSIFIPVGMAVNPYSKTNWEGTGVEPDVKVDPAEALKQAHIMAIEKLMAKATDKTDKDRLTAALGMIKGG